MKDIGLPDSNAENFAQLIKNSSAIFDGQISLNLYYILFITKDEKIQIRCSAIEEASIDNNKHDNVLKIITKDFEKFEFHFKINNSIEKFLIAIKTSIQTLNDNQKCFPFMYKIIGTECACPWQQENLTNFIDPLNKLSAYYRITEANAKYFLCNSYGRILAVASNIPDNKLDEIKNLHVLNRFPVISYINPDTKSQLFRCSKPLDPPLNLGKDHEPQFYMDCITPSTSAILLIQFHNILGEQIIINSNSHRYTNLNPSLTILNVNVLPVATLGTCLTDLAQKIELISQPPGENLCKNICTFYHWGDTVQTLIQCTNYAHNFMFNQQAVVIAYEHNGMDYALVVTSLVHAISRPFCRTISGFLKLIEYEWIYMGHPFFSRRKSVYFDITKTYNESGSGPTFLLFLNCIYQLLMMNMTSFEFTDKLLKVIYHHSFSSDYGDFLFDSPKEREDKKGCESTLSLFSRLCRPENVKEYLNPIFDQNSSLIKTEIPSQNYKSWDSMFMKSTSGDFYNSWDMLRNFILA